MAEGKLKLVLEFIEGDANEVFGSIKNPLAVTETRAMQLLGADIKTQGRAEIRRGGLSGKWANALRVQVYPQRGVSLEPAVWIWHKIPYAGIFEKGGEVRGKPILWVPLSSMPKKIGGKRPSPRSLGQHLIYVDRGSKPPLLVGKPPGGFRKGRTKASRGFHARYANSDLAPLFIGLNTAHIRKRFSLQRLFESLAARLESYITAAGSK